VSTVAVNGITVGFDDEGGGDLPDRFRRLCVLAEAYGLSPDDNEQLVDAIIENKRIGSAFVRNRARAREPALVAMWEQRGGEAGDARIVEWFEANLEAFLDALNG
jgi:hypothetical protein